MKQTIMNSSMLFRVGILATLILPGLGEMSMGEKGRATGFFIAEGLIWASMLVVVLKRVITHAAQLVVGIELSTQRAASCAKHVRSHVANALRVLRRPRFAVR